MNVKVRYISGSSPLRESVSTHVVPRVLRSLLGLQIAISRFYTFTFSLLVGHLLMSPVGMAIARITIGMQKQHQEGQILVTQLLSERKPHFSVDVDFVFLKDDDT